MTLFNSAASGGLLSSFRRNRYVMPGFSLTLGTSLLFVCLIILLPLSGLFWQMSQLGLTDSWRIITSERTLAAFSVTISAAAFATVFNATFGLLLAYVLVRYSFPGKRLLDALVDLPFALPTAVAGIALVALYDKNGWMGTLLSTAGLKVAYTWWGIVLAMMFTSVPFGVRTVQSARIGEPQARRGRGCPHAWRARLAGLPPCGISSGLAQLHHGRIPCVCPFAW